MTVPAKKAKPSKQTPFTAEALETEERRRRNLWHFQFGFEGENATEGEREAENNRRKQYRDRMLLLCASPMNPRSKIPRIPSIPTSARQQLPPPRQPTFVAKQETRGGGTSGH